MDNKNKLFLIINMIVLTISSIVSVGAVSYLYSSKDVSYDNSNSKIKSTNVQGAIEELYEEATDYSTINTKVTNLENNKQDKFANNTLYPIGDDVKIGDKNVGGTLVVQGANANGNVQVNKTDGTKITSILDINNSLATKAALASPTFTGTPKAPTAAAGTNTTQLATTAFVTSAVNKTLQYKGTVTTDLNNIDSGIYYIAQTVPANAPASSVANVQWCYLIAINFSGVKTQIIVKPASKVILLREYSGSPGKWLAWSKLTGA